MTRLLREPLLHFLLLGVALFLLYDWVTNDGLNDTRSGEMGQQIVVSKGRIEQLAGLFAELLLKLATKFIQLVLLGGVLFREKSIKGDVFERLGKLFDKTAFTDLSASVNNNQA